jgi:hypothetical protein
MIFDENGSQPGHNTTPVEIQNSGQSPKYTTPCLNNRCAVLEACSLTCWSKDRSEEEETMRDSSPLFVEFHLNHQRRQYPPHVQ